MCWFTISLACSRSEYLSCRNPSKTNSSENSTCGFPPKTRSRRRFLIYSGRLIRRKSMSCEDLPYRFLSMTLLFYRLVTASALIGLN
ncbi:hypothetical protein Tco_1140734, partial [Tanacetum coccineum]